MSDVKKFSGFLATVAVGGEAIKMIGDSSMPSGLKSATQSFAGLGLMGSAAKLFKFK